MLLFLYINVGHRAPGHELSQLSLTNTAICCHCMGRLILPSPPRLLLSLLVPESHSVWLSSSKHETSTAQLQNVLVAAEATPATAISPLTAPSSQLLRLEQTILQHKAFTRTSEIIVLNFTKCSEDQEKTNRSSSLTPVYTSKDCTSLCCLPSLLAISSMALQVADLHSLSTACITCSQRHGSATVRSWMLKCWT